jgi:hypothetical protein
MYIRGPSSESTEWLIESQAFRGLMIWLLALPPFPLSRQKARPPTHRKTEKERQLADGRRGRRWARSRIIKPQERLVLYKPFNTLWSGCRTGLGRWPAGSGRGVSLPRNTGQEHLAHHGGHLRQLNSPIIYNNFFSYMYALLINKKIRAEA